MALAFGCAVLCCARRSRAHESPAESPEFAPGDCISVVDKREQSAIEIAYSVRVDDVELMFGDIPLPDAKTHQFFAFRGGVVTRGFGHELYPFAAFADADVGPIGLPIWITPDDVKRAAQASDVGSGTVFSEYEIPLDAVLASNSDLSGQWLRVTADDARVPITAAQAVHAVRFELADVEPGLYTIAGYVFSPPYNTWAPRAGLVKIVDGDRDPPAAVLDPVHGVLFPTQGRPVGACIDAPAGTRVRGLLRVEERPEAGEIEWLPAQDVESGRIAPCFHNPRPDLTGSLRLLFELESPDGTKQRAFAPDTITALNGQGACQMSATQCCDFPGAGVAPSAAQGGDTGGHEAGGSVATPVEPSEEMDAPDGSAGSGPARRATGCVLSPGTAGQPGGLVAQLLAWLLLRRRSGSRRPRDAG